MAAKSLPGLRRPGSEAKEVKGFWQANRWLILRRLSQVIVLGLFLLGPLAGIWILKGNLSASMVLDTVPLADPFIVMQSVLAGHFPELSVLLGAGIITVFYAVLGGRVFCSWVCRLIR